MDETVMIADSQGKLKLVSEFGKICERRKLKVNIDKKNKHDTSVEHAT